MPLIKTARGTFYLTDHRRDDLPPTLLIHGAAGTHLDWGMPIRKLGTLAVDLNGHGKSHGHGHETLAEHADDLLALMDALTLESAVIAGHSMGGAVALTLALRAPERVRGLILMATGAQLPVSPKLLEQAETDPEAVADRLFRWLWSPNTSSSVRERGREQFLKLKPAVIASDYRACNVYDVRDRLSEIQAPTVIIHGTADVMVPYAYSELLAEAIPGAVLHPLDGIGHNLQIERAEPIAALLHPWLEGRSPAG